MKIGSRLGWTATVIFLVVGLIIMVAAAVAGESQRMGIFFFSIGSVLTVAFSFNAIWPLAMSQKERAAPKAGQRRQTGPYGSSNRTPTNPGFCAVGRILRLAVRKERNGGEYHQKWWDHQENCPSCRQATD